MASAPLPQSAPLQSPLFGHPNQPEVINKSNDEGLQVTLLVKHLPESIPHDFLTRIFSHYGATSVRPCAAGRLRNCAFVDFNSEVFASQAYRQLNGLRFLGKILSVVKSCNPICENKKQQTVAEQEKNAHPPPDHVNCSEGSKTRILTPDEPIAPMLGVDYSFPPHLEYAYPPPDANILTNITSALIAVPRLYTQVLHLMNKMNLPAPFRMAMPTPPLPPPMPTSPPPPPPESSSTESELESSEEEPASGNSRRIKRPKKRFRHGTIVGPAVDKDVAHESVGVKPATLVPKELPLIKKKNPVLQIKIGAKGAVAGEFSKEKLHEPEEESAPSFPYATAEDLKNGKLPYEEILSLPMFKNYAAGNPAPVLYIKNLAKDVVPDDFYFVFGSLFGSISAAKSGMTVKLMQEGRMRGQAFVTFPSVDLATQALNLVNGYVFKGKPMITQFGRNPTAMKSN